MMSGIEKIIALRILNYWRVRHGYARQYNIFIPFFLTFVVSISILEFSTNLNFSGSNGLLGKFSQILAILAPFYIASLAAVTTFAAQTNFDEPFLMVSPPKISHFEQGQWIERLLTLRQFLSLLFGYCSVISFFLFLISIFVPSVFLTEACCKSDLFYWGDRVFLIVFLFAFCHMLVATLLGLYYLCDKMHRPS